MPEMSGLELVKRIRADIRLAKLPVIAVTSLTGETQKKEGFEAGFDAYEHKLDRSRLLELVNRILQERGITA
jgi:two-component system chemotaxis sensor kinase CheA